MLSNYKTSKGDVLAIYWLFRAHCDGFAPPKWNRLPFSFTSFTDATKTSLSHYINIRHFLLLNFRSCFRKTTAESFGQPKIRTSDKCVVASGTVSQKTFECVLCRKPNNFDCWRDLPVWFKMCRTDKNDFLNKLSAIQSFQKSQNYTCYNKINS